MSLTELDVKNKLEQLQHIKHCAARWFWDPYRREDSFNVNAIEADGMLLATTAFFISYALIELSVKQALIVSSMVFALSCVVLSIGLIVMLRARTGADSALDSLLSAYRPLNTIQYQALKDKATLFSELRREDVFEWIECESTALRHVHIADSRWNFARTDAPVPQNASA